MNKRALTLTPSGLKSISCPPSRAGFSSVSPGSPLNFPDGLFTLHLFSLEGRKSRLHGILGHDVSRWMQIHPRQMDWKCLRPSRLLLPNWPSHTVSYRRADIDFIAFNSLVFLTPSYFCLNLLSALLSTSVFFTLRYFYGTNAGLSFSRKMRQKLKTLTPPTNPPQSASGLCSLLSGAPSNTGPVQQGRTRATAGAPVPHSDPCVRP